MNHKFLPIFVSNFLFFLAPKTVFAEVTLSNTIENEPWFLSNEVVVFLFIFSFLIVLFKYRFRAFKNLLKSMEKSKKELKKEIEKR